MTVVAAREIGAYQLSVSMPVADDYVRLKGGRGGKR